jgi:hypothetical protein
LRLGEKKIRVLISKKGIMRAKAPSRKASGMRAYLRKAGSASPQKSAAAEGSLVFF